MNNEFSAVGNVRLALPFLPFICFFSTCSLYTYLTSSSSFLLSVFSHFIPLLFLRPAFMSARLDSTRLDSIRLDSVRLGSTRLDSVRFGSVGNTRTLTHIRQHNGHTRLASTVLPTAKVASFRSRFSKRLSLSLFSFIPRFHPLRLLRRPYFSIISNHRTRASPHPNFNPFFPEKSNFLRLFENWSHRESELPL